MQVAHAGVQAGHLLLLTGQLRLLLVDELQQRRLLALQVLNARLALRSVQPVLLCRERAKVGGGGQGRGYGRAWQARVR